MMFNVFKEYIVLEKKEYENNSNFGEFCIFFKVS